MKLETVLSDEESTWPPPSPTETLTTRRERKTSYSAIDFPKLVEQCDGDAAFAFTLLDEFAATAKSRRNEFATAAAEGNLVAIRKQSHALMGVAGILRAAELMRVCDELELASANSDLIRTLELVAQVCWEMERCQSAIPDLHLSALAT